MVKNAGTGLLFSYVKKDEALTNIKEIPAFRVTIKGLEGNSKFGYRYLATEDATRETLVYLGNGTHELAKSFAPTKALLDLTRNAWVGIFITPMVENEVVFDCDITIEVLPEYENGLAYDGVEDYSENVNIPIVDDFTFLVKASLLKGFTGNAIAKDGKIDIEGIVDEEIEIIKSIPNFDFNIPVLGNGNISNGNITLSIPFINKGIMFNQSDLETFRQLLIK